VKFYALFVKPVRLVGGDSHGGAAVADVWPLPVTSLFVRRTLTDDDFCVLLTAALADRRITAPATDNDSDDHIIVILNTRTATTAATASAITSYSPYVVFEAVVACKTKKHLLHLQTNVLRFILHATTAYTV